MKRQWIKIFGLIICCTPVYGQMFLKDFKFVSWFGHELNGKKENVYSLLGVSFFGAPSTDYADSLISNWIQNHPNAIVVPVYTSGPIFTDYPKSMLIYCWIVDNSDTLNITLVKMGCIPGRTMQRPLSWDDINNEQRKLMYDDKKPTNEQVHVDSKSYTDFWDKVVKAENEAMESNLGVWAKKKE